VRAFVFLILVGALAANGQQSKAPAKKQQQQQHAHAHGAAKINIGIEGNSGTVEFEAAADPIIGFEHKPKTAADQKKVDAALASLKARFGEMVVFPASLGCKFTAVKAAYEVDGQHAEVHAEFKLQCAQPLKGAAVMFGVSKLYPEIENVEVQAVSETGQTGGTIRKDKGSVKIG
jgi:hypothetical protein